MTLIERAREFARSAHHGQVRKYTGEPYFNHVEAVAKLVDASGARDEMVAKLVDDLTDPSQAWMGNRAHRKAMDLQHTAQASPYAKTIKLADLIDNTKSIVKHDPAFAKLYLVEKEALLQVLKEGDDLMWAFASIILEDAKEALKAKLVLIDHCDPTL